MKCENCGKNEVSFLYRSSVNGKVEEKCLCAECAEKLGYTQRMAATHRNMMQNFFGSDNFIGNGGLLGSGGVFDDDGFFGRDGIPGGFFGNSGFWGLPALVGRMLENPFDDFFTDMPALGAVSDEAAGNAGDAANAESKGKGSLVDCEEESRFDRWRRLNALKQEMKKAVHREDFERAAQIRDEIRALEGKKSA